MKSTKPTATSPVISGWMATASYIGVSRSLLGEIMRDDPTFPRAIQLGPRRIGFFSESLNKWLEGKQRRAA